jgi:hypothetical protein
MENWSALLEPEANVCSGGVNVSIAISLKRIADALTSTNEYGECGSEAIYAAIRRGLRDGR